MKAFRIDKINLIIEPWTAASQEKFEDLTKLDTPDSAYRESAAGAFDVLFYLIFPRTGEMSNQLKELYQKELNAFQLIVETEWADDVQNEEQNLAGDSIYS